METNIKTIVIGDAKYTYNMDEAYEKDGHVYCKKCNEQKDGKVLCVPFSKEKKIFSKECKCDRDKRKKEEDRIKECNIRELKKQCFDYSKSFQNASLLDLNGKDACMVEQLNAYVETFDKMAKDNIGILLSGPVGTGKSYIAAAIANKIIEKYQYRVKFRSIPQIIRSMQRNGFKMDQNQFLSDICSAKLVVFDDFGIERQTEYVMELLYAIINERYGKNLPTVITTNITISEITDDKAPIEFQRIYSRILSMCNIRMVVNGRDRRKDEDKEKMKKAMDTINDYIKTQEDK